ncbi:hypothetical protein TCAL_06801 [Tigriopus californicus]|uniref:Uncharacterized protein n=1 Tax=Tigriopus californicus TaxID=6832 RepID=A0A553PJK0_TIGCA|nr:uncharacterized protein LOC131890430 [Tigriopus californicus]TRY77844.1 hypothetical protein TCAL_06801 [Tigriopus californicus]|eukprot:TCALIF_06801-PA protein Name:"Protein of unknown function" AED:0.01 eAED:0.01 QI:104/1/1/1/1/1/2/305/96
MYSKPPIEDDTVSSLRQRLHVMKEIFGDSDEELLDETSKRRRQTQRRKRNCIDTIIDGSFMGMVLAICLVMVLSAAFFAYKNLYHAVMKKMYPEQR